MEEDLKRLLELIRDESASRHAETHHHFDMIAEGLRHELRIVAEGVTMNSEQLARLETKLDQIGSSLDARVTRLEAESRR